MTNFSYRAVDDAGHVVRGAITAINEFDLEAQLKNNGLSLIKAKPVKDKKRSVSKLTRRDLINFLFYVELSMRAGVPILSIMADLRDTSGVPSIKNLSAGLFEKIDTGSTISEALMAHPGVFPLLVSNLVRAGEATGQLPHVLEEIVISLKWQDELASKAKQLMIYPTFVFTVVIIVTLFLMIYLVPQIVGFITLMGDGKLPVQTRLLIWVSATLVKYWTIIIPMPFVLGALGIFLSKTSLRFRRMVHYIHISFPYIGPIIKKIILARVTDTFGLTYRTGIRVLEGLDYCSNVTENLIIKEAIIRARTEIANGAPISRGFASQQLFPPLVISMIRVGEETGDLTGSLKNVSYFYNREINESIGRVQAIIEPTLTVVLGILLGWIMMAVLGPIYDTLGKLKF